MLHERINFDLFNCDKHKKSVLRLFSTVSFQKYVESVLTFLNSILRGRITPKIISSVLIFFCRNYITSIQWNNKPIIIKKSKSFWYILFLLQRSLLCKISQRRLWKPELWSISLQIIMFRSNFLTQKLYSIGTIQ